MVLTDLGDWGLEGEGEGFHDSKSTQLVLVIRTLQSQKQLHLRNERIVRNREILAMEASRLYLHKYRQKLLWLCADLQTSVSSLHVVCNYIGVWSFTEVSSFLQSPLLHAIEAWTTCTSSLPSQSMVQISSQLPTVNVVGTWHALVRTEVADWANSGVPDTMWTSSLTVERSLNIGSLGARPDS